MNKVLLTGYLGSDVKKIDAKITVAVLNVGTKETIRNKDGEWEEITIWLPVKIMGKPADNALKVLDKGDFVEIDGRISKYTWKNDDGKYQAIVEIISTRWNLVRKGKKGNDNKRQYDEDDYEDDIEIEEEEIYDI